MNGNFTQIYPKLGLFLRYTYSISTIRTHILPDISKFWAKNHSFSSLHKNIFNIKINQYRSLYLVKKNIDFRPLEPAQQLSLGARCAKNIANRDDSLVM